MGRTLSHNSTRLELPTVNAIILDAFPNATCIAERSLLRAPPDSGGKIKAREGSLEPKREAQ